VPDLTRSAAVLACFSVLAACGGATPTTAPASVSSTQPAAETPAVSPNPTADIAHPVGVIAIGHSGLTGEGTARPSEANRDASWATGSDPAVNSIYLRLVEAVPATEGVVSNQASGGAGASELFGQATRALHEVPAPLLAIVQTVDNDVQCPPSNASQVGTQLDRALQLIHSSSPNTIILVVGQAGRPSMKFIKELVARVPSQKAGLTGADDDLCAFFHPDGTIWPEGFERAIASIDTYEAETARVCALVPNCHTDGGVRRTWVDELELFSSDYNHFNVKGQAAEAEQLWPVVEELLGL
jgi:hypothetical protein